MGKLKDLWAELNNTKRGDPKQTELRKEINKIEEWMVSRGIIKSITVWDDFKTTARYPWHVAAVFFDDTWMVGKLNGKGINYNDDHSIHVCDEC